ncbi:TonB-dependent receptor [Hyphobacterium sp. CCMP332]|nr:TonB-dependent receptor [Hyphobacterium sp. CCMP332]
MKYAFTTAFIIIWSLSIAQDSLKNIELEEVYIIGIRAKSEAPVSKTTIRKAELQKIDLGQDASLHLERLSPSIVTYSDAGTNFGNYMSFRLRGMAQDRINVTLNGIPLNDMLDQGVYFSNFADFSNSIESVQIQRGVGTSSNGTSSYAGSINYESISLYSEKPKAELRLSGGSFGSMGLAAEAYSGKNEKGFSAYARASRMKSEGYKDYSGSDAHSFFFSGGYIGEKHVIKITGFMGKTQNHQSYEYVLKDVINKRPRTNNNNPNDIDDFEQDMAQLQHTFFFSKRLSLSSILYYTGARGYFPYAFPQSVSIPVDTLSIAYDTTILTQYNYGIVNNQYGATSNLHYHTNDLDVDAGIHLYTFNRRNTEDVSPNAKFPYLSQNSFKDEASVFIKASKRFDPLNMILFAESQMRYVKMSFEPGQDGINSTSKSYFFLNPRIGITYNLRTDMNLYASFGRTGREPTRIDFFSNDFSIKEEFVNDIELGYRLTKDKLKLNLNAFYMDFENEITELGGVIQNTYFEIRQNVASSQRYGLELETEYRIIKNLDFRLMASYLRTNIDNVTLEGNSENNVEQVLSPDFIVTPELSYTFKEKFSINVNARYLSEAFTDIFNQPEYQIPSSLIFNSGIDYKVSENVSASLFFNNITDELYFTDGAPIDTDFDGVLDGPGFRVQAPRNIMGRLTILF